MDAVIGGEQSGHILFFDGGHTTGDGMYTAIRVADVIVRSGKSLRELASCMTRYPQVLVNVRVPRKPPFEQFPSIQEQIEKSRGDAGRQRAYLASLFWHGKSCARDDRRTRTLW